LIVSVSRGQLQAWDDSRRNNVYKNENGLIMTAAAAIRSPG
jgi:hypothetical protein